MSPEIIFLTPSKSLTDKEFVEFFISELAPFRLLDENKFFKLYGRDIRRLGSLSKYEDMSRYHPSEASVFSLDYLLLHVSHAQARL